MAEIGAKGTGVIKGGGGKGKGGYGTVFLLKQAGLRGVGPVSFGGEQEEAHWQYTGQSVNQVPFSYDGIKGAYNTNINQQWVNNHVVDPPGGVTVAPYVLYGMSGVVPSPVVQFIGLHPFLDEKFGQGGTSIPLTHRRSGAAGIGGYVWFQGSPPQQINLQDGGPSSISELMGNVPHDPFAITGNQSTSNLNQGSLGGNLGVLSGGLNSDFLIQDTDSEYTGTKSGAG